MPHEFDDLIAELDAAKADLARSVRRCRSFLAARQPPPDGSSPKPESPAFPWSNSEGT